MLENRIRTQSEDGFANPTFISSRNPGVQFVAVANELTYDTITGNPCLLFNLTLDGEPPLDVRAFLKQVNPDEYSLNKQFSLILRGSRKLPMKRKGIAYINQVLYIGDEFYHQLGEFNEKFKTFSSKEFEYWVNLHIVKSQGIKEGEYARLRVDSVSDRNSSVDVSVVERVTEENYIANRFKIFREDI